ncbi:MAG TPA: toxin-antitoxin system YwqK family antitoxin [Bacteroidia bacterium]|jgi:antitoxin component YwqK of YwqJK toxin-antitoxin module|nr:toxin-antitoxin system YwqK family antitoxin [Bacteroidia bacterium]
MRSLSVLLLFVFLLAGKLSFSQNGTEPVNPNGYNKFYYDNGKLSSEGMMRDGKPDGYWKTYYENGKIKSEGNRKDFQLDSTWKFYTDKGKLQFEYTYANGKKNGPLRTYDEQGRLILEETFINNMKQGPEKTFYTSGKLNKETPFKEGHEDGIAYEYDTSGTIITITEWRAGFVKSTERINRRDVNGQKQGTWKEFYPNGKVKTECPYTNDKKNGYYKEYNEFGNLTNVTKWVDGVMVKNPPELAKIETRTTYYSNGRIHEVGNYKDSIPEGVFRIYDTTGVITAAEVYADGILVGEGVYDAKGQQQGHWKEYYEETGDLKGEGDYKDGVRIGDWKFYYADGKTDQLGKYDNKGRPVGVWKWYYDTGQELREETYTDGLRNGTLTEYDESGNIITQGEYVDGLQEGHWFFQIDDYREEGDYVTGERTGVWKHTYIPGGQQRFEGNYTNGQPDGKFTYWYDNGRVWQEGKYVYGRKDGDWKYFDEDGLMTLTITYKDGVEVKFDGVKVKFEEPKTDGPQTTAPNN